MKKKIIGKQNQQKKKCTNLVWLDFRIRHPKYYEVDRIFSDHFDSRCYIIYTLTWNIFHLTPFYLMNILPYKLLKWWILRHSHPVYFTAYGLWLGRCHFGFYVSITVLLKDTIFQRKKKLQLCMVDKFLTVLTTKKKDLISSCTNRTSSESGEKR